MIGPPDAILSGNIGVLLDDREDDVQAEAMYRKAIELDPKQTAARWNLSCILDEQKNDTPGAIKQMEEYVRRGGFPGFDGKKRLAKLRAKLETSTQ